MKQIALALTMVLVSITTYAQVSEYSCRRYNNGDFVATLTKTTDEKMNVSLTVTTLNEDWSGSDKKTVSLPLLSDIDCVEVYKSGSDEVVISYCGEMRAAINNELYSCLVIK